MWKKFFKRRRFLKTVNALELVPVTLVRFETNEECRVKLYVPRFANKILQNLFTGKRLTPEFTVSLDETGSMVWLLIDGQRSVGEISAGLKKNFENKDQLFESAEERIVAYISKLYEEDYITFAQLKY
jgi:hypothetical protein